MNLKKEKVQGPKHIIVKGLKKTQLMHNVAFLVYTSHSQ